MNTAVAVATGGIEDDIEEFKSGVDALLEKRRYVVPLLIAEKDFYVINGRRSLNKSGAEKLAGFFGLTAAFRAEVPESFRNVAGLVCYVCVLSSHDGKIVGEGRGAATLQKNDGDPNKCLKMAQKSAFIDSVIRSTILSEIFTQDLETMPAIQTATATEESPDLAEMANIDDHDYPAERSESERVEEGEYEEIPVPISERQESYLRSLAMQNLDDGKEKEQYLANIQSLSKSDACSAIKAMLLAVGR